MDAEGGISKARGARQADRWSDAGSWEGDGLRRDVFFFPSSRASLYGSLYAPAGSSPSFGLLLCNSWGYEGDQGNRFIHPVSLALAEAGASAAGFHYPGFGDSFGVARDLTVDDLVGAALDALYEVSRRSPGTRWLLGGFRLGASVAALVADRHGEIERLLLVQPVLRPGSYFARLERAAKRSGKASLNGERFAFGYPLSDSMLGSASAADGAVEQALGRFRGEGTVVRYAVPEVIEGVPEQFEHVCATGAWRFGAQESNRRDPALVGAATRWLSGHLEAIAAR